MTVFQGIFLGFLQGLTEFLPISSSGHLVLFTKLLNLESNLNFDLLLHFGTLLSIIVYYRKKIKELFMPPFRTLLFLIVATIPAGVAILIFRDLFESMFSGKFLPISFMFTAIILFLATFKSKPKSKFQPQTYKSSLVMGVFQAIAIIPGVSRSGMTISAGLMMGLDNEDVANFSFFMSIPIILGSMFVSVLEGATFSTNLSTSVLATITSFLVGLLALKLVINSIKKAKFHYFSYYLVGISIVSTIVNIYF